MIIGHSVNGVNENERFALLGRAEQVLLGLGPLHVDAPGHRVLLLIGISSLRREDTKRYISRRLAVPPDA